MDRSKKTILIIEDETGIADTLLYALERDGFLPVWKSTGGEALRYLDEAPVNLVVLDLGLPDTDGLDLLKHIRSKSDLPVLILSARNEDVDRIVGLEVGADDFVSKPFSPREVTARVRAILRRVPAREEQSAPHEPGGAPESAENRENDRNLNSADGIPFVVDQNKKVIYYYGKPLELSRYEYGILDLLIRRPGWVFTREQIMDQVWTEPEEFFDRVVDTHIKNIRSRLKAIRDDEDPILTRRGIGYSLKEWRNS